MRKRYEARTENEMRTHEVTTEDRKPTRSVRRTSKATVRDKKAKVKAITRKNDKKETGNWTRTDVRTEAEDRKVKGSMIRTARATEDKSTRAKSIKGTVRAVAKDNVKAVLITTRAGDENVAGTERKRGGDGVRGHRKGF